MKNKKITSLKNLIERILKWEIINISHLKNINDFFNGKIEKITLTELKIYLGIKRDNFMKLSYTDEIQYATVYKKWLKECTQLQRKYENSLAK